MNKKIQKHLSFMLLVTFVVGFFGFTTPSQAQESWFNHYSFHEPEASQEHLRIREAQGEKIPVEFVRIVDGDTVRLIIGDETEEVPVRLIGMDTPESVHPDATQNSNYGEVASDFAEHLLKENQDRLFLEFDVQSHDRYQRVLGYLWIDDLMVNEILLAEGFAQIATFPPNTRYVDQFILTQEEAREDQRGFWSPEHLAIFQEDEPSRAQAKPKAKEADLASTEGTEDTSDPEEVQYIGNANTYKFHYPSCSAVKRMKESNKVNLYNRDSAINNGYDPCGICHP